MKRNRWNNGEPFRISFRGWFWIITIAACLAFWTALIWWIASSLADRGEPQVAAMTPADYMLQPPERFQGDVTTVVYFTRDPNLACVRDGAPPRALACTGPLRVVLPHPCLPVYRGERFAQAACHEAAHRNGWPAHNPVFQ